MLRLSGLRGDARTLRAMEKSKRQIDKFPSPGNGEYPSKSHPNLATATQSTSSPVKYEEPLPPVKVEIRVEIIAVDTERKASTCTFLHPRPRYTYGDLYAPVYQPPASDDFPPESDKQKSGYSFRIPGMKCNACTEDAGRACIRVRASLKGSDMGKALLCTRALQPHLIKKAVFELGPFPPGPSRLRRSFTDEDLNECEWSDTASISSISTIAVEEFATGSDYGADRFADDYGASIVLSPSFATINMSQIFGAPIKDVDSCVEDICPAAAEEGGGPEDNVCSSEHRFPAIKEERDGWGEAQKGHNARKAKRPLFAQLPKLRRRLVAHSRNLDPSCLLNRVADTSWRHVRTFKWPFLRRKIGEFP